MSCGNINQDLIKNFNTVISNMISHIVDYYSDKSDDINKIHKILKNTIKVYPKKPILYFINNVYINDAYRKNLLEQNDAYFMNYTDKSLDKNTMNKMFEFKDLWKKIDDDTKTYIKRSMMALVLICQEYILNI